MTPVITVVEGVTDLPFAQATLAMCGATPGTPVIKRGHGALDRDLRERWNRPSNRVPMLVVRDLDPALGQGRCPPSTLAALAPDGLLSSTLCLRLAERELEAWVLADVEAAADFFGIPTVKLPAAPDELDDPKQTLVNLCRRSRIAAVRSGMTPRAAAGRTVGPDYTGLILEFARVWSPRRAIQRSPSLQRAALAIQQRVDQGVWPKAGRQPHR